MCVYITQFTVHSLFLTINSLHPAAEPEDFMLPVPPVVVFPVGGPPSAMCATIDIQTDTELEGDHDFTVLIVNTNPGPPHATVLSTSSTTAITIIDDDCE